VQEQDVVWWRRNFVDALSAVNKRPSLAATG
jgi:hypothetical protein